MTCQHHDHICVQAHGLVCLQHFSVVLQAEAKPVTKSCHPKAADCKQGCAMMQREGMLEHNCTIAPSCPHATSSRQNAYVPAVAYIQPLMMLTLPLARVPEGAELAAVCESSLPPAALPEGSCAAAG